LKALLQNWNFVSHLGVKEDMPVFMKKSIILFNQIVRVLGIILIIASITQYLVWGLHSFLLDFLILFFILAFTLLLCYYGKIKTAIIVFANILPLYILLMSFYNAQDGSSTSIYLYIIPRLMIGMVTLVPVALVGFLAPQKAIFSGITGAISFTLYDWIHTTFGEGISKMNFMPEHYNILVFTMFAVLIFSILLIIFLQNISLRYEKMVIEQKNEIGTQKAEIEAQRDEIEMQRDYVVKQRDEIVIQKKQITDSILYAKRIQTAILPPKSLLNKSFPEHFIFFRPRDIVSGDFFFCVSGENQNKEQTHVLAVADCTGHGVPGAFMSMLGISYLNEIVANAMDLILAEKYTSNLILDELRNKIKLSLHQTGKVGEAKDGMDIALCIIAKNYSKLQFSGANNPLYIIRSDSKAEFNYEIIEVEPDDMPIGIYENERTGFSYQQIDIESNDSIYMFSDGYKDQFGGEKGRKFLSKNFKSLLINIQNKHFSQQKEILENTFDQWKGDHNQVDDVLVLGIQIP